MRKSDANDMRKATIPLLTALIALFALPMFGQANKPRYVKLPVAFYNLENLFDTIPRLGIRNSFPTERTAGRAIGIDAK